MPAFGLGLSVLKRLCFDQNALAWQRAKLTPSLFKPAEQEAFQWVTNHVHQFHALPQLVTLQEQFPDVDALEIPEPLAYYISLLENRYFYDRINTANVESQQILTNDKNASTKSLQVMKECIKEITSQKYRLRILDVPNEAPALVLVSYHKTIEKDDQIAIFGWPYMDTQFGGVMAGDMVSFIGRPATGKTWQLLWTAIQNWTIKKQNILFVSMEMSTLPIAQRLTALYTGTPIQQLKVSGFSHSTMKKFYDGIQEMTNETGKFYVIDGNLAASVEDIFVLADMMECPLVFIDGAYLLRHPNMRLDRFNRAAENVEMMKRYCTDSEMIVFCSWQFNRVASQKQKKGGSDSGDLEDIGYSDAIGQISSIVLGLFEEDSVETMKARKIRVLKGRNGEVGQFSIHWDFNVMSFKQSDPPLPEEHKEAEDPDLHWL